MTDFLIPQAIPPEELSTEEIYSEYDPEEVGGFTGEAEGEVEEVEAESYYETDYETDAEIVALAEADIAAEEAARGVVATGYSDAGPTLAGVEASNPPSIATLLGPTFRALESFTDPIRALVSTAPSTVEMNPIPPALPAGEGSRLASKEKSFDSDWLASLLGGVMDLVRSAGEAVEYVMFSDDEVEVIVAEAPRPAPRPQPQRVAERRAGGERNCPLCAVEKAAVGGAQMAGSLPVEELSEDDLPAEDGVSAEDEDTAVANSDVVTPAPASAQGESTSGQQGNPQGNETAVATTLGESSTPQTISQNPTNGTIGTDSGETSTVVVSSEAAVAALGAPLAGMAAGGAASTVENGVTPLGRSRQGSGTPTGTVVAAVPGGNSGVVNPSQTGRNVEEVGAVAVRGEIDIQTGYPRGRVFADPRRQTTVVGTSGRPEIAQAQREREVALAGERGAKEADARTAPVLVTPASTVARDAKPADSDIAIAVRGLNAPLNDVPGSGDKGFGSGDQGRDRSTEAIPLYADLSAEPEVASVEDEGPSRFDVPAGADVVV